MSFNRSLWRVGALAVFSVYALPAFAQGPNFDWAGPYMGVQGGFDESEFAATGSLSVVGTGYYIRNLNGTWTGSASQSYGTADIGDFGPFVGYNFQSKSGIVLGGEADFHWAKMSATSNPLLTIGACDVVCTNIGSVQSSLDWYGTVRGTIGQSIGRMLFFGTGGLAYGDVSSSVSSDLSGLQSSKSLKFTYPLGTTTDSGMRYGWTAGAGMAIAINEKVSLRVLYLHTDLGEKTIRANSVVISPPFTGGSTTISSAVKDAIRFNSVLVGLTVRFP